MIIYLSWEGTLKLCLVEETVPKRCHMGYLWTYSTGFTNRHCGVWVEQSPGRADRWKGVIWVTWWKVYDPAWGCWETFGFRLKKWASNDRAIWCQRPLWTTQTYTTWVFSVVCSRRHWIVPLAPLVRICNMSHTVGESCLAISRDYLRLVHENVSHFFSLCVLCFILSRP